MSQKTQIVNIYTDGSCRGNGKEKNQGGWAALIDINGKQYTIGDHIDNTTNNRMELIAVLKGYLCAIRRLPLEDNLSDYTFNIYTDIVCAKAEPDIGSASQGFCKEMQE